MLGISSSTMKIWLYLEYSFIKLKSSIPKAESLQRIIHFITKISPQSTMTQGITLGRVIYHLFPQLRGKTIGKVAQGSHLESQFLQFLRLFIFIWSLNLFSRL